MSLKSAIRYTRPTEAICLLPSVGNLPATRQQTHRHRRHIRAHPTIRAYTNRTFSPCPSLPSPPCQRSGPRPMRSITPGRNGSMSTSARAMRRAATSTPRALFMSSAMERLFRHSRSPAGAAFVELPREFGGIRSMRVTDAPKSARMSPAKGPGARPANCAEGEGRVGTLGRAKGIF